ncbi:MAG TPA: hypothetical protein VHZ55_22945 [Bryobacteraceae bacterium]|jgi:transposase-like protein|nr:hypothetical protein [Bryobacteraceae bacterium]
MPRFVPVEELFKARHFDHEIVVHACAGTSATMSYRDLTAMMGERGIEPALAITIAGARICHSAKTPRNADEHRLAPKARW